MFGIRPAARFAMAIAFLAATLLWFSSERGILPNPIEKRIQGRMALVRTIALNAAVAVESNRLMDFREVMKRTVESNEDIVSVGVLRSSGRYSLATNEHESHWNPADDEMGTHVAVDLQLRNKRWGELQILFRQSKDAVASNYWYFPLSLIMFVSSLLCLGTWFLMSRILRSANPGTVVPQRVRSALDTLTEGLALINQEGSIVHSNEAFDDMVGVDGDEVLGKKLEDFGFERSESVDADSFDGEPWDRSSKIKANVRGSIRKLARKEGLPRKFIINASPILAEKETVRGVLVSFDDVTALENKKNELGKMIHTLRQSRDEISRQNVELQFLANCDPLTKCYNRRSFWLKTEEIKDTTAPDQLSIIMIDIDHFKSINDTYGHSTGDDVLRDTGELLRNLVAERGFVCRYGGEEFCIIVAGASFDGAVAIANEIRTGFHENEVGTLSITASIGVSNASLGAMDMQHMLDQADQCLYAAKRNGRDQVVRFDQCDFEMENSEAAVEDGPTIEYSTVNGLLSALAFRSSETAEHSIRVADLAVAIGNKLLPKKSLYRFEIAALMHDVGKIGVPDALLNKAGLLTPEEATMMKNSRQIGLDIVSQAFACDEISEILRCHHMTYSQQQSNKSSIDGQQFPLASRIITACDAFDSMVNKKAYRKGMTIEEAVRELIRCTPDQFDPVVVEALITYVTQPGYVDSRNFQLKTAPESAMVIGQHVGELQSAVANNNVEQLQAALKDLKADASASDIAPITDAAVKLEAAIQVQDGDELADVIDMAEEVLALCRSTRQAIVNPVQSLDQSLGAPLSTH